MRRSETLLSPFLWDVLTHWVPSYETFWDIEPFLWDVLRKYLCILRHWENFSWHILRAQNRLSVIGMSDKLLWNPGHLDLIRHKKCSHDISSGKNHKKNGSERQFLQGIMRQSEKKNVYRCSKYMTFKRLASAHERQRQGGSPSDDEGGVTEGPSWCGIQYLIDSEVMAGWCWVAVSRLRRSWWAPL